MFDITLRGISQKDKESRYPIFKPDLDVDEVVINTGKARFRFVNGQIRLK